MDEFESFDSSDGASEDDSEWFNESSDNEPPVCRGRKSTSAWQKEAFIYPNLNLDSPAFRLLRLHKGTASHISCDLFKTWLDGPDRHISYEALSYTWGSTDIMRRIEVNGKRLDITVNLYSALYRLRSPDHDRVLWVDAICINQSHKALAERGHQVRHMTQIYTQADGVIFWLDEWNNESTPAIDAVFSFLAHLREEGESRGYLPSKQDDPRWVAIWTSYCTNLVEPELVSEGMRTLLARRWFRRVWILQEVANARAAFVCFGNRTIQARYFALASRLVGIKTDRHCLAVLEIMPGSGREDSRWGRERSLYTLLKKFGAGCEASDPRDKIYALLGLSTDAKESEILVPNYKKEVGEVIRDAFYFLYFCKPIPGMLWTIKTMEDFIVQIRSLNHVALEKLVSTSETSSLRQLLDRDDVEISDSTITATLQNESGAEEVMSLLINRRGPAVRATKGVLAVCTIKEALSPCGLRALGILLRHNIVDTDMALDSLGPPKRRRRGKSLRHEMAFKIMHICQQRYHDAPASWAPIASALVLSLFLLQGNGVSHLFDISLSKHEGGYVGNSAQPCGNNLLGASREEYKSFLQLASFLLEFEGKTSQESAISRLPPSRLSNRSLSSECVAVGLCIASYLGSESLARFFLENGGNINATCLGQNTLSWALEGGHEILATMLIDKGAFVNGHGRTMRKSPLLHATERAWARVVDLLLQRGANPNLADAAGNTPLTIAAGLGHSKIIELLLQRDADPNLADCAGKTPLSIAARLGYSKIIELLLQRGADPNLADCAGNTALCLATDARTTELLFRSGAPLWGNWNASGSP